MGKKVRRVTVFVVCAVVLQLLCLLFLTPEGIEHLFPLRVRLAAEKIKPESNTYAAYYDMRMLSLSEWTIMPTRLTPCSDISPAL